jgi:superkiller protein 3
MSNPDLNAADDDALRRGMMALSQGRAAEAERLAREVAARLPGHPGVCRLLGVSLLAQGRPADAVTPFEQALARTYDTAIETMLGAALRQSGRFTDAVKTLDHASTQQPPFPPALLELGLALTALRRYDEAEAALRRGRALVPQSPDVAVALGDVLMSKSDRVGALDAYQAALRAAPGHPGATHGYGTALLDGGDFAKALGVYQPLIASGRAPMQSHLNAAYCLLELGRFDEGIARLRAIVAHDPRQYGSALKMLATSSRGRIALRPSEMEKLLRGA